MESNDYPEDGQTLELFLQVRDMRFLSQTHKPCQENDLIIVGTDGLYDNLYNKDIITTITEFEKANEDLSSPDAMQKLADILAEKTFETSKQKSRMVPFGRNAKKHGLRWAGGKKDDITVLIARVISRPHQDSDSPLPAKL